MKEPRVENAYSHKGHNPMHRRIGSPGKDPGTCANEDASHHSSVHARLGTFGSHTLAIDLVTVDRDWHGQARAYYLRDICKADFAEVEAINVGIDDTDGK